jgi:hypothetical protein
VYPKVKAVQIAKANNMPVPSMPNEFAANTMKPTVTASEPHVMEMKRAPLMAQKPTEEEVEVAEVFLVAAPPAPDLPESLPTTASSLPVLALCSLFALAGAGFLSLLNGKIKTTG